MKSLYIFLTRTESIVSKIVYFFTRAPYTHSAIAFDEDLDLLCSSSRKDGIHMFPSGPCREYLNRGFYARPRPTPCTILKLDVSEEVYQNALLETEYFLEHHEEYKFNILGLMSCKFGIGLKRRNKFFCSQFVAEILTRSGAVSLPKPPCLMRPIDYTKLPQVKEVFKGNIKQFKNLKQKETLMV